MAPSSSAATTATPAFPAFPRLTHDLVLDLASFLDGATLMRLALTGASLCSLLLPPPSASASSTSSSSSWPTTSSPPSLLLSARSPLPSPSSGSLSTSVSSSISSSSSSSSSSAAGIALWCDLLRRDCNGAKLLRRRQHQASTADFPSLPTPPELYATAHRLRRLGLGSRVAWQSLPRAPRGQNAPPPMEGHTACLLADRWMVMIGGFTSYGVRNDVYVLDTWAPLDKPYPQWTRFPAPLAARPPFHGQGQQQQQHQHFHHEDASLPVYGHVCCALSGRHVAVFGGVTMGGYQGDVNDFHILEFDFGEAKEDGKSSSSTSSSSSSSPISATTTSGSTSSRTCHGVRLLRPSILGQPLTSRAYGTMTLLSSLPASSSALAGPLRLLLLGGIHHGQAIMQPELLTLLCNEDKDEGEGGGVWEVARPAIAGPEPGRRMGHSCSYLPGWRCMVVVGGSDGSDLLRNGRELLRDVYFLDLEEEGAREGRGGSRAEIMTEKEEEEKHPRRCLWPLRWTVAEDVETRPAPVRRYETFTGRTHTAHVLGEGVEGGRDRRAAKVLLFGGDSRLSDAVGVLEVREQGGGEKAVAFHPLQRLTERRPGPRLSHASVLASGERLLVHGGWCEYERGDMHSLSLAPSYGSLASVAAECSSGLGSLDLDGQVDVMSEDEEEEDESEEEEEEEEEESDYIGSSEGSEDGSEEEEEMEDEGN